MWLLSKLFGRQPTKASDVYSHDKIFEDDASKVERIINAYGEVMIKRGEMPSDGGTNLIAAKYAVAPVSMLPYPKAEIKEAIKLAFKLSEIDRNMCNSLITAYSEMAQYIPDEEAKKVFADASAQDEQIKTLRLKLQDKVSTDTLVQDKPYQSGEQPTGYALEVRKRIMLEECELLRELHQYLTGLSGLGHQIEYSKLAIESIIRK